MTAVAETEGRRGSSATSAAEELHDFQALRLDLDVELSQSERQKAEDEAAQKTKELTDVAAERLRKAMEVNRFLHDALVRKKSKAEELRKSIEQISDKIERATEVELPARADAVVELEERIMQEQQLMQEAKLHLGRGLMEREEKVEELTKATADLRELGARNRTMLRDQHAQVKDQQREVREMRRHIQIMEGGETPQIRSGAGSVQSFFVESEAAVPLGDSGGGGGGAAAVGGESPMSPRRTSSQAAGAKQLLTIDEMNTLPGLDLQSLLSPEGGSPRSHSPGRRSVSPGGSSSHSRSPSRNRGGRPPSR